jgi:hypothetical protein
MLPKDRELRLRRGKIPIRWLRLTEPSPITDGKMVGIAANFNRIRTNASEVKDLNVPRSFH